MFMSRLPPATTNVGGRRRPRSPDVIPPQRTLNPTPETLRRSPTTDRIVKKGRTNDNTTDNTNGGSPSVNPSVAPQRGPTRTPLTHRQNLRVVTDPAEAANAALLSIGRNLTKLVEQTQHLAAPDTPGSMVLQQVRQLKFLAEKLEVNYNETYRDQLGTTTPTPARVERTAPRPAPVPKATQAEPNPTTPHGADVASAAKAPSSARPRPTTRKQDRRRTTESAPKAPPTPVRRLIYNFPTPLFSDISSPRQLRDSLNEALKGACVVEGVNRSPAGNLILHAADPHSAQQLLDHRETTWPVIEKFFGLDNDDDVEVYLDVPWHRIVVHNVPWPTGDLELEEGLKDQWRAAGLRSLRALMPEEKLARLEKDAAAPCIRVSMMLALENGDAARDFVRRGMFMWGAHCRVSVYNPRTRRSRK
ncbi:hypothetical protein HMN09_00676400 [Mycena chlorophos]|uniref:Uncharacterized protein n=1 Tax=Mycena chlorophos TaxID=658473 RepID=A0A8H6SZN9_MYCCL|nr:hypothetical protein HMN09_00676400 [Mycena chlorophos]